MLDLYDEYCHGRIDRREFLHRAGLLTVGGVSALAMAQAMLPRYALAQTISFTDQRIKARYVSYPSPGGTSGTSRAATEGFLALDDHLLQEAPGLKFRGSVPLHVG